MPEPVSEIIDHLLSVWGLAYLVVIAIVVSALANFAESVGRLASNFRQLQAWLVARSKPALHTSRERPQRPNDKLRDSGPREEVASPEQGENSNGHYVRFSDGRQECSGRLAMATGYGLASLNLSFPASFASEPVVDLTGDLSSIVKKHVSPSGFTLTVDQAKISSKNEMILYRAAGRWQGVRSAPNLQKSKPR